MLYSNRDCEISQYLPSLTRLEAPAKATDELLNARDRTCPDPLRSEAPIMVAPNANFLQQRRYGASMPSASEQRPDTPFTKILQHVRYGTSMPSAIEQHTRGETPAPSTHDTPNRAQSHVADNDWLDTSQRTAGKTKRIIEEWEQELRSNFQPSRRRPLYGILASTASGAQRAGSALPRFLPRGLSAEQALDVALLIGPFQRTLELAFSVENRIAIHKGASSPKDVKASRHKVIRHLTALAHAPQPARQRLAATLPTKSPARNLHIPSVAFSSQETELWRYPVTDGLCKRREYHGRDPKLTSFGEASQPFKQTSQNASPRTPREELRST